MRRALVLTHVPFEDCGSLGAALEQRDFLIQMKDVCTADLATFDEAAADLLVVLGGPIGAYETTAYPFLEAEIALLRARLQREAPTIGICLGAQLMAVALGAAVYPGAQGKEIGWSPVQAGRDIDACPAMAELLDTRVPVLHWHGDTFDLPPGAAHLASTGLYVNQAWSLGAHALALQFHPEVTSFGLERWYVGHACELSAAGIDIAGLRTESRTYAPVLEAYAQRFWNHWLDAAFSTDSPACQFPNNRSAQHA